MNSRNATNGFQRFNGYFLIILMVISLVLHEVESQAKTCDVDQKIEDAVVKEHNDFRKLVATKGLDATKYGSLNGSNALFALTYECTHEKLAALMINKDCTRGTLDISAMDKGLNFYGSRVEADPTGDADKMVKYFEYATKKWKEIGSPLTDVIYNDNSISDFANMVNYRALEFGCNFKYCAEELALACVYSSFPRKGEAIYLANSKNNKGCTSNSQCKKVVKEDGECDTATNVGLCKTKAKTIDSTTTAPTTTAPMTTASIATTASPQPSTPTMAPTSPTVTDQLMTDAIRTRIVDMHNWRRSQLANGNVRNGKAGKANFKTAMNIYEMKYDRGLETEAQNYADLCQSVRSAASSRQTGENIYTTSSTTTQALDVVVEGIKSWWRKIFSVGINYQMLYTQQLENKPNSPVEFTQMAWAATYKVGCGLKRCSFGTVLVCRYSPRGNVYNQYIYTVGTRCGSCSTSCNNGLCVAPAS